jgi:hypothetical protein
MVSILGANSVSGGYEVSNSLRFNDGDSASLNRTLSGSGTQGTYTFSAWIKRSAIGGSYMYLFSHRSSDDGNAYGLAFHTSNNTMYVYAGSGVPETTGVFRDPAAWYHIVLSVNSTSYTLYVNGTSIKTGTAQSLVYGKPFNVGNYNYSSGSNYFDGYMTEVHFIDGTAKAATDFGEFDDNGVWVPIKYTGSYGTNGVYLEFQQTGTSANSSGIGADTSGNDNHFAVNNLAATDVTEDTCTNNFATFNALFKRTSVNPTFSEGNLKVVQGDSNGIAYSTIGVSSGKWYVEIKVDAVGTATSCGILEPSAYDNGNPDTQALYYQSNGNKNNKGTASSYGASYTTNDIIGIAFDADNGILAFYKNGSSQGNAFTGLDTDTTWLIGCHGYGGSASQSGNYGNPAFAISSGNSDGKYGNFEYAPPSGYYALCTKRLAEFG